MFFYIFNLILVLVVYVIIYNSYSSRKLFLIISFSYLFLFSSLRDQSIGADYGAYVSAFNAIKTTGTYYMEKGYVMLNLLVSKLTNSYVGIAIAVNLMLFVPLYYLIRNKVDKKYWGLCVFIFASNPYMFMQTSFNAMRQGCATGLILVGMYILLGLKQKSTIKYIKYFAIILLAAQFHRIAYVTLLIPIILEFNWKRFYWLLILCFSLLGNMFGVNYIIKLITSKLKFNASYLTYPASSLNHPIYVGFIVFVILYLLYHYGDFERLPKHKKQMVDLYIFSLCFLLLALPNDMIYRTYILFAFCALPSIPIVCQSLGATRAPIKFKHEQKIVEFLYVSYYLMFNIGYMALLALSNNSQYIPFKFCFS